MEVGVDVEVHHHEVGTAGQGEIDIRFGEFTETGDKIALYKYIIKNMARANNLVATFMPKPLFPRQRFRDARPPESLERRKEHLLRSTGIFTSQ